MFYSLKRFWQFFLKFFTFFTILTVFTIFAVSASDLKYSMFNICEISSQLSILQTDKHVCPKCFFRVYLLALAIWIEIDLFAIFTFFFQFFIIFIYFSIFSFFFLFLFDLLYKYNDHVSTPNIKPLCKQVKSTKNSVLSSVAMLSFSIIKCTLTCWTNVFNKRV